jgi:hypothetical protein
LAVLLLDADGGLVGVGRVSDAMHEVTFFLDTVDFFFQLGQFLLVLPADVHHLLPRFHIFSQFFHTPQQFLSRLF